MTDPTEKEGQPIEMHSMAQSVHGIAPVATSMFQLYKTAIDENVTIRWRMANGKVVFKSHDGEIHRLEAR